MKITGRQEQILDRIVNDYIDFAKPISSEFLEKKHDFKISPATIRIEMQKLTDLGFLYQPHTSAGRIPTDKGFRFFVDSLFEKEISDFKKELRTEDWVKKEMESSLRFIQTITKNLALASSNLAISYLFDEKILWKEGWEGILQEPEFKVADCISNFAKFLNKFEGGIEKLKFNSGIKVYIGKENPFSAARDFSIIISHCYFPDKEKGIISLSGPKRMAYKRNIALINSFKKILENF